MRTGIVLLTKGNIVLKLNRELWLSDVSLKTSQLNIADFITCDFEKYSSLTAESQQQCSSFLQAIQEREIAHGSKGMLTIFKWPKHLIVLNFVNSGITINKMAKVFITLIS